MSAPKPRNMAKPAAAPVLKFIPNSGNAKTKTVNAAKPADSVPSGRRTPNEDKWAMSARANQHPSTDGSRNLNNPDFPALPGTAPPSKSGPVNHTNASISAKSTNSHSITKTNGNAPVASANGNGNTVNEKIGNSNKNNGRRNRYRKFNGTSSVAQPNVDKGASSAQGNPSHGSNPSFAQIAGNGVKNGPSVHGKNSKAPKTNQQDRNGNNHRGRGNSRNSQNSTNTQGSSQVTGNNSTSTPPTQGNASKPSHSNNQRPRNNRNNHRGRGNPAKQTSANAQGNANQNLIYAPVNVNQDTSTMTVDVEVHEIIPWPVFRGYSGNRPIPFVRPKEVVPIFDVLKADRDMKLARYMETQGATATSIKAAETGKMLIFDDKHASHNVLRLLEAPPAWDTETPKPRIPPEVLLWVMDRYAMTAQRTPEDYIGCKYHLSIFKQPIAPEEPRWHVDAWGNRTQLCLTGMPIDIQNRIWGWVIELTEIEVRTERYVDVVDGINIPRHISRNLPPNYMHVCRASRSRGMQHFPEYSLATARGGPGMCFFNPDRDTLFLQSRYPKQAVQMIHDILPLYMDTMTKIKVPHRDWFHGQANFTYGLAQFRNLKHLTFVLDTTSVGRRRQRKFPTDAKYIRGDIHKYRKHWHGEEFANANPPCVVHLQMVDENVTWKLFNIGSANWDF